MLQPTVPARRVGRDGAAQLQLVRRYARILRETTAESATARRSTLPRTAQAEAAVASGRDLRSSAA